MRHSFCLSTLIACACLLSNAFAEDNNACSASVSVVPTQPGHASYKYNDIVIRNTGSNPISKVFVSITLPPNAQAFAYYNVSDQTGELFGLSNPMPQGSMQLGGVIVLNSARMPIIIVANVECVSSNTTNHTARHTPAIKVETQWGANPWWIAIAILDEDSVTSEVRLTDSAGSKAHLMKKELWSTQSTFTFTPRSSKLVLPISLELTSVDGQSIVLKNAITKFSYAVLDTGVTYAASTVNNTSVEEIKLHVSPAANSQHIALTPYGSNVANITNIYLKAQNMVDWTLMQYTSVGIYELSAQSSTEFQLPISIKVLIGNGNELVFDNAVKFRV